MFDELFDRMDALAKTMRGRRYDGHSEEVRAIIDDARATLTEVNGSVGPWETDELDYALRAVNINFLTLALTCVAKAIEVSQLATLDYDGGYNYSAAHRRG